MSCGKPHETDCSEVLDHLYEYLDNEMSADACAKFRQHFDECRPCLEKYGLEQAVKKLVKRCCGHDEVPVDLRAKVLGTLDLIRAGRIAPGQPALSDEPCGPGGPGPEPKTGPRTGPKNQPAAQPVTRSATGQRAEPEAQPEARAATQSATEGGGA